MHASTESACLRKLSDWVNSVSKHHAALRSMRSFPVFSLNFRHSRVALHKRRDLHSGMCRLILTTMEHTLESKQLATLQVASEMPRSGIPQTRNGHSARSR